MLLTLTANSLWSHKRRLMGALIAVTIGVAFLTGTLLLSDSLRANFSTLFAQANGGTDVVVRGATKVATDSRGNTRIGIPATLLGQVRSEPGVADAQPYQAGFGRLLGADGKAIGGNGPPTEAANWVPDPALNPYRLVAGRPPLAAGEVVINRGAAKTGHLALGDTTTVEVPQPVTVRVVGLVTFGTADGFGPGTFTGFTFADAQRYLTNRPDQLVEILVKADPGVDATTLAARIGSTLPPAAQTITGSQLSQDNLAQLNSQFLGFLRAALLAFAVIALIVAAFTIHNTLAIVATQRSHESALLRALGASRRQVLGGAVVESLAIGTAGSALGLLAGVGVAGLLKGLFQGFGFALPAGGLALRPMSIVMVAAVGVVVTLVAGAAPAWRGARVAPLAAIRDADATEADPVGRPRLVAGALCGVGGVGAAMAGATIGHGSGNVAPAALGLLLVLAAVVLLGPVVAGPAARFLGRPVARMRGLTGRLAGENASRQPRRTSGTAGPLLVGIAVVVLFTVVATSLKSSLDEGVRRSVAGDLVVGGSTYGRGDVSPQLVSDIARVPGVGAVAGLGAGSALVGGTSRQLTIADPGQLAGLVDLHLVAGRPDGVLGRDQLAVSKSFARSHLWGLGTTVAVTYPDGASGRLVVQAINLNTAVAKDLVVSPATFGPHDAQAVDNEILVRLAPGASLGKVQSAVIRVAAHYGAPPVQTLHQYQATASQGVNTILGLVYVLLALSILIALLGIANTLALSIFERTRELGLLRAVGQARAQTRSMIRWEAVIVSFFGTLGGLAVGVLLGWALVRSASGTLFSVFALPLGQMVVILLIGALAGVLASVRPARRAARLDPLQALVVT